jgi:hypothetical protein
MKITKISVWKPSIGKPCWIIDIYTDGEDTIKLISETEPEVKKEN